MSKSIDQIRQESWLRGGPPLPPSTELRQQERLLAVARMNLRECRRMRAHSSAIAYWKSQVAHRKALVEAARKQVRALGGGRKRRYSSRKRSYKGR